MIDRGRLYRGPGAPLEPAVAFGGWALAVATFFVIGMAGGGVPVEALAQVVGLAVLPVLVVRVHGGTLADLGLTRPPLLPVVGAVVAGAGAWLVALHLALPVMRATEGQQHIEQLSRQMLAGEVATVLVLRALVPGVCEEVLHRGLLLGALAPRYGRVAAIVITTVLFAALHLEPARMVATAVVGLLAALLAVWARSIVPAMVVHVVNNATALALGLGLVPSVNRAVTAHPDAALVLAGGLVAGGLGLAWLGRQGAADPRAGGIIS